MFEPRRRKSLGSAFKACILGFVGWMLLGGWLGPAFAQSGSQELPVGASASLPLEEVLRLHRERDEALDERRRQAAPPIEGAVDSLSFRGRVLEDALEMRVRAQVTVFADPRFEEQPWVQLPLLEMSPQILLNAVPSGQGFSLAVVDEQLVLLAKQAGSWSFELSFLARAELEGDRRRVILRPAPSTAAVLTLEVDDNHFELLEADGVSEADGFRLFAREDLFEVVWRRLKSAPPVVEAEVARPPIEAVVEKAQLSTVSTLEGDIHHRLRYDLRFEGQRQWQAEIPDGTELHKVFVNGRSVPFEPESGTLSLTVEPVRAGDRHGSVELVMRPPRESYHLSGELVLVLPAVSWPINHVYARLHLPEVFTYRWSGGSLAPAEAVPKAELTYVLPTPGDELVFQQTLVHGSSPTLRVAYDIELEGQYFTGP